MVMLPDVVAIVTAASPAVRLSAASELAEPELIAVKFCICAEPSPIYHLPVPVSKTGSPCVGTTVLEVAPVPRLNSIKLSTAIFVYL